MRQVNLITIHCSATPNGRRVTAEQIDGWHKARGFRRDPRLIGGVEPSLRHIGYHYVIYAEGAVRIGRGEREMGAHAAGHNANSIGICMVGTDAYSHDQWLCLQRLVDGLLKRYPKAAIKGHRDLSPDRDGDGVIERHEWLKTCPGFDVSTWLAGGKEPLAGHILE